MFRLARYPTGYPKDAVKRGANYARKKKVDEKKRNERKVDLPT